jgi:septum formation protein
MHIILGSSSPSRKELFDRLGIAYTVSNPEYEEIIDPNAPTQSQVKTFAQGKAMSIYPKFKTEPNVVIMGFDSMIQANNQTIGKAHSADAVTKMITSFVGNTQQVVSGFCLCGNFNGQFFSHTHTVSTDVTFRADITPQEIQKYLTFNDWQGKCGAYSILGPGIFLLASIHGDFQNIIGVPIIAINKAMQKITGQSLLQLAQKKEATGLNHSSF